MTFSRVLLNLMRVSAMLQLIVGVGLWSGHWYSLLPLHWANGVLFVVLLWTMALSALVQRRAVGVALGAILWGLIVVALEELTRGSDDAVAAGIDGPLTHDGRVGTGRASAHLAVDFVRLRV